MKVKRKAIRWLTSALAVTLITSNTAVAATWKQDASGTWYHYNDQNVKTVGWYHDTDGKWYYLMSDGKMLAHGFKIVIRSGITYLIRVLC